LTLVSVAVGVGLAVAYQLSYLASQRWLSVRFTQGFAIISVAAFFVRLTALVLIIYAIAAWTELNLVAVVLSFIIVFTIVTGYTLYRFAKGRPPTSPQALI
jgi:hypothetical protein